MFSVSDGCVTGDHHRLDRQFVTDRRAVFVRVIAVAQQEVNVLDDQVLQEPLPPHIRIVAVWHVRLVSQVDE
jgi:hypothetical protein